jgi:hypothetical protein
MIHLWMICGYLTQVYQNVFRRKTFILILIISIILILSITEKHTWAEAKLKSTTVRPPAMAKHSMAAYGCRIFLVGAASGFPVFFVLDAGTPFSPFFFPFSFSFPYVFGIIC